MPHDSHDNLGALASSPALWPVRCRRGRRRSQECLEKNTKMNEADTCRQHVVPKLQAAGWDDDPHSIAEQRTITDGRIVPQGQGFIRKPPKRVDYLLCYRRDFPLAVVEAKAAYKHDLHKRKAPVFFPSLDKEGWRGAPGWFEYSARSLLLEICID